MLTPGRLWAVYVAGGLLLCGGVAVGVVSHREEGPSRAHPTSALPSAGVLVENPARPKALYPQGQQPVTAQAPSCNSVTAVDTENVSQQFVIAVGNAYVATTQAAQCQGATVVAHSEVRDQDYTMTCVPAAGLVRCTGGQLAVIVFRPGT